MPHKRQILLAYRLLVVLAGAYTMYLMARSSVPDTLVYYTNQSNILVFAVAVLALALSFGDYSRRTGFIRAKAAATMAITVTFVIFFALLADPSASYFWKPYNFMAHAVMPLLMIVDWLLFDPRGRLKKLDPLLWCLLPLAYFAFAMIRAASLAPGAATRYVYPFIDPTVHGAAGVAGYVASIAVFFSGLGYLAYWYDQRRARKLTL